MRNEPRAASNEPRDPRSEIRDPRSEMSKLLLSAD